MPVAAPGSMMMRRTINPLAYFYINIAVVGLASAGPTLFFLMTHNDDHDVKFPLKRPQINLALCFFFRIFAPN